MSEHIPSQKLAFHAKITKAGFPMVNSIPPKYRYDAFISYSRRDKAFAKALETALENFRPPKGLPVRMQNLDIFRDESDLTGTAYHESIELHLQQSAKLILICSPDAARSEYVADEIRRFVGSDASRGHQIIPILYRGIPNNEAGPQQEEQKAFPAVLYEYLEMPLGINYLEFDPAKHKLNRAAYLNSWYALLANICDVSRGEIEERERRRQARRRKLQVGIVGAVFAALSTALIVTLISRQQAVREQHLAESGQLSANAINVLADDPQLGLLLGFEAAMRSYSANKSVSVEVQDALHRALLSSHEQLRISANSGGVHGVAFSPARRVIATAGAEGVQFWDAVTGSLLPMRIDGIDSVLSLAFSPDGSQLATAGRDGAVRLWNATTGREQRTLRGHLGPVWSVVFTLDGSGLATASADGTARMWDTTSGREMHTFTTAHPGALFAVAVSHDGKLLATGGADQSIRIWDVVSGRLLHELADDGKVHGVAFSPDGASLATVNLSAITVKIWDVVSGRQLRAFGDHTSSVFAVAYSPDGSKLITASIDKTARLWDSATGKELFVFRGHTGLVTCVAFSDDGEQIVTGAEDGTARSWKVREPYEFPSLVGHTSAVNQVAFSPDGTRVATGSDDGTARIWLATTGRELHDLSLDSNVNAVAFSPDGKRLVAAASDGTSKVFDAASGIELFPLTGHGAEVKSVAYSGDGRRIVTGSSDGTAKIWEAASGKKLATIVYSSGKIDAVDLNRNATRAAIGVYADEGTGGDGAQIWDVQAIQAGHPLSKLDADYVWVNQVRFSPDGKRLVTTGSTPPYLVKEWDTASGQELLSLSGHAGEVLTAAYSPNGSELATGGEDAKIKLWDSVSGRELLTLSAPNITVNSVAFSPDGKRLASAGSNREVRLFAIDPADLVVLAASRLRRPLTSDECRRYLRRDECSTVPSSKIVAGNEMRRAGDMHAAMAQFSEAFAAYGAAGATLASKRLLSELFMSDARDRVKEGDLAGATKDFRTATLLVPLPGTDPGEEVASAIAMAKVTEAKQLAAAGRGTEEISLLKQAVALDPKNEPAYRALAQAYDSTHEYDKSIIAMQGALKVSPSVSNMIDLANNLRLNRDYPAAISQLNQAIAANPRSEWAHRILGLVFLNSGDSARALSEFNAAIAISPTQYALYEQAGIYKSRKDFTRALEALKKAETIDPNYVDAYQDAGQIYHDDLADFEAAYRELAVAHGLAPNNVGLQADFAEACLTSGRFQEALDAASGLLDSPLLLQDMSVSDRLAMKFIRVAALELNGSDKRAAEEQKALIADFTALPAFKRTWNFSGTRRFLTNSRTDPEQRASLLKLLDILDPVTTPKPKS